MLQELFVGVGRQRRDDRDAIRQSCCLIKIKARRLGFFKLQRMLAIERPSPTHVSSQNVVQMLEGVRLARQSVTILRGQLEADRPRHDNLLSRSRELLAQSEDLLSRASQRTTRRSPAYRPYDHLAQAERHVEQGYAIIARQREIVAALERGGHNTREAIELLADFENIQKTHVSDRDRLLKAVGFA